MEYRTGSWDLAELVPGDLDEDGISDQLGRITRLAKNFQKHRSKLDPSMDSKAFLRMLKRLEAIYEDLSMIGGLASLEHAADTQSDRATTLLSVVTKLSADTANRTMFFDLWWKKDVDEANARRLMDISGDLRNYLRHKRRVAEHTLSGPEEKIINTLDVTGASALARLYDKITNAFEYTVKIRGRKRTMTREEISGLVRSPDADTRADAYRSLLGVFSSNIAVLGEIYQNIVRNWNDEGVEIRGYRSPISVRNAANDVDDESVSALLSVCSKNAKVFQKFFVLKARLLGMKRLSRYDLYAPVAPVSEKSYTYDEAARMVLDSLGRFSPVLAGHARRVFEESHIDSSVRKGKRDGAFCSTITPGITPYVLLNFTGKSRDVFTLAHELGHAVHSMAASGRSILVQQAPLPLAETASTFSELLLYDSISDSIGDGERRVMLAEKLDDFYATIMRQAYFTMFESHAHWQDGPGATVGLLSYEYRGQLAGQFGRCVDVPDEFAYEWSCIPHFYHTPFYCYAYAFGNLLALSLFRRFKKEGRDFVPSYMEILSAGGAERPDELLSHHGIDISSENFWQDGFDYIGQQIRTLGKIV